MMLPPNAYDAVLFDLDGTLIRGRDVLPHAARAVGTCRQGGCGIAVVTNNASRAPAEVSAQLVDLGLDVGPDEIVTSAQAGARVLADLLDPGAEVLVVGTAALAAEVESVGLVPVREARPRTAAVVQGHSPDTCWRDLAQACLAIRAGAQWVACNRDATLPTDLGELPGNGAMVAALVSATGARPTVAGKPERPLMDVAAARCGASTPLVVGDRLDTDIAGGIAAGADTLLVLTGVTRPVDLLAAADRWCPTYLAADLRALTDLDAARVGSRPGWSVGRDDGNLVLTGAGDPWDALRVLCAEASAGPADRVVGSDAAARNALHAVGLEPDTVER